MRISRKAKKSADVLAFHEREKVDFSKCPDFLASVIITEASGIG